MKKMQIALFLEKFKLFLFLQNNWNSVSLYLKILPILYGMKIKKKFLGVIASYSVGFYIIIYLKKYFYLNTI